MPEAYLTASQELLPSIRFYDRISTTVLNAYVGPPAQRLPRQPARAPGRDRLRRHADDHAVQRRRGGAGGARRARAPPRPCCPGRRRVPASGSTTPARTAPQRLPAPWTWAAPASTRRWCVDGEPVTVSDGEINRYRIALPMLDINTIGAGGGKHRLDRRGRPAAHGPRQRRRRSRPRLLRLAAAPGRRRPTPTSRSATSTPTSSPAARSSSTRRRPRAPSRAPSPRRSA